MVLPQPKPPTASYPVLSGACDQDMKLFELPWDLGMTEAARTSVASGHVHTHPSKAAPALGQPPATHALASPPTPSAFVLFLPGHPQGPAAPAPICCLCPSRKVSALFSATSWGEKEKHPEAESSSGGGSSLESAADGGGPSGAHVDEFLGGNHVPSALARCHPVFSSPSESLNFAHLS